MLSENIKDYFKEWNKTKWTLIERSFKEPPKSLTWRWEVQWIPRCRKTYDPSLFLKVKICIICTLMIFFSINSVLKLRLYFWLYVSDGKFDLMWLFGSEILHCGKQIWHYIVNLQYKGYLFTVTFLFARNIFDSHLLGLNEGGWRFMVINWRRWQK
jgi:hypothetical protein